MDPKTREMVDFVRAMLEKDKAVQQSSLDKWHAPDCSSLPDGDAYTFSCDCGAPERILADIAAKQAVVDDFVQGEESLDRWACPDMVDVGRSDGIESVVIRIAALYATDPAYPLHLRTEDHRAVPH